VLARPLRKATASAALGRATEDVDVKTRMTWALALATTVLVGCGERAARPAADLPVAEATTRPAAPAPTVAAATTAAPSTAASPTAPAPAAASPTPAKAVPAKVTTAEGKLTVKRLVVAQGVKGREPVSAATSFAAKDAGKIYAFVEVENKDRAPAEITVSFEPPGGGASHGNVKLDVGAEPRWRTWAFTRTARTVGAWTAVVKDHRGDVLARAPFEITL